MRRPLRVLALVACLVPTGCAGALPTATNVANVAHELLTDSRSAIQEVCVPAYEGAKTRDDVARVDAVCLPARAAYTVLRAAWVGAVAAILVAESTGDLTALREAVVELAKAGAALARTLGGLP